MEKWYVNFRVSESKLFFDVIREDFVYCHVGNFKPIIGKVSGTFTEIISKNTGG